MWSDLPKIGTTKKMDLISLWERIKQLLAKTWLIKLTNVFWNRTLLKTIAIFDCCILFYEQKWIAKKVFAPPSWFWRFICRSAGCAQLHPDGDDSAASHRSPRTLCHPHLRHYRHGAAVCHVKQTGFGADKNVVFSFSLPLQKSAERIP